MLFSFIVQSSYFPYAQSLDTNDKSKINRNAFIKTESLEDKFKTYKNIRQSSFLQILSRKISKKSLLKKKHT